MLARTLFGLGGGIGRRAFIAGSLGMIAAGTIAVLLSLAALPWLASMLAPRGINAALVLNAIWALVGVLIVWSLIALAAKRLRATGRWPWWGAVAVLPLAVLAVANDTLFLASRYVVLPVAVQYAVLAVAGGIGVWVLFVGSSDADRDA